MAIAMAPDYRKSLFMIGSYGESGSAWDSLLNLMADDNPAKQLSCSWNGGNVADPVAEGIFEQMAVQGQSIFVSSGDTDAYPTGTNIAFPDDSPHVTVVGGTSLQTSGPGGTWEAEAVWNWNNAAGCTDTPNMGCGGGVSTNYAIPLWQTNVNVITTTNHGSKTMRNMPDVALTADEVFVYLGGTNWCVAGTSCAAPLWAGFTALVNQQAAASNSPPVGFLNPALYAIGAGPNYTNDFRDTTNGNNFWSGSPTNFPAVSGYDLSTGWGTPRGRV